MLTSSPKIRLIGDLAHTKISRARGALMNAALIQDLLGIPTFTHKIRSSDGSYMEVRAQEDGAHNIEISRPTSETKEPQTNAPRYGFWIDVVYSDGHTESIVRSYLIAKVKDKIRGHTNTAGADNPVGGTWKVIGYDDLDPLKERMPRPRLGFRGWADKAGMLYDHNTQFKTNTPEMRRPDRDYPYCALGNTYYTDLNRFYPQLVMGCTGMYSAASHHAAISQFHPPTGLYFPSYRNNFATSSSEALGKALLSKAELHVKLFQYLLVYDGSGEESAMLSATTLEIKQLFSIGNTQAAIVHGVVNQTAAVWVYVHSASLTLSRVARLNVLPAHQGNVYDNVEFHVAASINTTGTRIVYPHYPAKDTHRTLAGYWFDDNVIGRTLKGCRDYLVANFFREILVRPFTVDYDADDYSAKACTPVMKHFAVTVDSQKVYVSEIAEFDPVTWEVSASHESTTLALSYCPSAEEILAGGVLVGQGSLHGYRSDALVTTDLSVEHTTNTVSTAAETVVAGSSNVVEVSSFYSSIFACMTCLDDKNKIAYHAPTMNAYPYTYEIRLDLQDGYFCGYGGAYTKNAENKISDAWSSLDKTATHALSGVSVQGLGNGLNYMVDDVREDVLKPLGSQPMVGDCEPFGGGQEYNAFSIASSAVSVAEPFTSAMLEYTNRQIGAYNDLQRAIAAKIGGGAAHTTATGNFTTITSEISVGDPCRVDIVGDRIQVYGPITTTTTPSTVAAREPLNIDNIKYNLTTGGTTLQNQVWVNPGVYGLDAVTGIFDPMLGVVERMFSGYLEATLQSADEVRLHMLEVKLNAETYPIRIIKAETLPHHYRTDSSALDHYPRATYCGYVHGGSKSSICASYGQTHAAFQIGYGDLTDFQSACIVDGDNGNVIDVAALCGISNTTPIGAVGTGSWAAVVGQLWANHIRICEIPEEMSKQDWPQ